MLIQASTPRPLINLAESPEYVRVHAMRKTGVSKGEVFFNMATSVEHGNRKTVPLEPHVDYSVDGQEGFALVEYYIPFDRVFDGVGRDLSLALLGAGGYLVTIHSAFRADMRTYEERMLSFQLLLPVTGGGIIRLGDSLFDITNPTLDPKKPIPRAERDPVLANAVNRTHALSRDNAGVEKRRADRLAAAKASEARVRAEAGEVPALMEAREIPALPEKTSEIPALPAHSESEG